MKMIDSNGRLFGKISVIDILVLLVVAVMAAALYVKTNQRDITSTTRPNDTVVFQIMARSVRSYVGDAVRVGDLLFEEGSETGGALGEIIDIEVLPGTMKAYYYEDGTIDPEAPAEDCVNLLITVRGEGIATDADFMINRVYHLGVNANRSFATPYALFSGFIWDVLPQETAQ